MKKVSTSLILASLSTLLFLGCSSDSTNDDSTNDKSITLSGTFDSSYAFYKSPSWYRSLLTPAYAAESFNKIKKAIAVPIHEGSEILMHQAKTLDINEDGSFSASLETNYSWVILLQRMDGNFDFVSIPVGDGSSDETLVNIPVNAAESDLNLGTITRDSGSREARSSKSTKDLAKNFSFSSADLDFLADMDNAFKAVANNYRNNFGKSQDLSIQEKINIFISSTDLLNTQTAVRSDIYDGFSMIFNAQKNHPLAKAYNDICHGDKTVALKFPTTTFTLSTSTKNFTGSIESSGTAMNITSPSGSGDTMCQENTSQGIIDIGYATSHGGSVGIFSGGGPSYLAQNAGLPYGLFDLQLNNQSVAKFNLDYNLPVTADKHLKVPIASFKLHADSNDKVDYIDVQWYLYNEVAQDYKPVVLKDLQQYIGEMHTLTWNDAAQKSSECPFNSDLNRVDMTKCSGDDGSSYFLSGSGKHALDSFGVQYDIGSTHVLIGPKIHN